MSYDVILELIYFPPDIMRFLRDNKGNSVPIILLPSHVCWTQHCSRLAWCLQRCWQMLFRGLVSGTEQIESFSTCINCNDHFRFQFLIDVSCLIWLNVKNMQGTAKRQGDTERAGIKMWNQNSERPSSRESISRYTGDEDLNDRETSTWAKSSAKITPKSLAIG